MGSEFNFSQSEQVRLEVRGGEGVLGGDLSFIVGKEDERRIAFNVFNQRAFSDSFSEGDLDIELPGGDTPWVHRTGGGLELLQPFGSDVDTAIGFSYQDVSVRDGVFSSTLTPFDELGNPLTVSPDGRDELVTFNLGAQYANLNDDIDPTEGTRIRFGLDQSIPVGDADISMTRLSASASQFIPVKLFGFRKGPRTIVLNVQGGHIFGDVPPYEAFNLGGDDTVRGFESGELGTGQSFIQASAEYRFPLFGLKIFKQDLDIFGTFFVDYGSTLDTQDEVIGIPGIVRAKPGEGVAGGFGLRARTGFGVGRLELGFADDGGVEVSFGLSERF